MVVKVSSRTGYALRLRRKPKRLDIGWRGIVRKRLTALSSAEVNERLEVFSLPTSFLFCVVPLTPTLAVLLHRHGVVFEHVDGVRLVLTPSPQRPLHNFLKSHT